MSAVVAVFSEPRTCGFDHMVNVLKMSAFTHRKDLFTEDGVPLVFSMVPCLERNRIGRIIEHGGGRFVHPNSVEGAIKLVPSYTDYVADPESTLYADYISQCASENKLLPQEDFRFKPRAITVDSEYQPSAPQKGSLRSVRERACFSLGEEISMAKYVENNCAGGRIKGNRVYQEMARDGIVPRHTWQSLREHYIKKIFPHKQQYLSPQPSWHEVRPLLGTRPNFSASQHASRNSSSDHGTCRENVLHPETSTNGHDRTEPSPLHVSTSEPNRYEGEFRSEPDVQTASSQESCQDSGQDQSHHVSLLQGLDKSASLDPVNGDTFITPCSTEGLELEDSLGPVASETVLHDSSTPAFSADHQGMQSDHAQSPPPAAIHTDGFVTPCRAPRPRRKEVTETASCDGDSSESTSMDLETCSPCYVPRSDSSSCSEIYDGLHTPETWDSHLKQLIEHKQRDASCSEPENAGKHVFEESETDKTPPQDENLRAKCSCMVVVEESLRVKEKADNIAPSAGAVVDKDADSVGEVTSEASPETPPLSPCSVATVSLPASPDHTETDPNESCRATADEVPMQVEEDLPEAFPRTEASKRTTADTLARDLIEAVADGGSNSSCSMSTVSLPSLPESQDPSIAPELDSDSAECLRVTVEFLEEQSSDVVVRRFRHSGPCPAKCRCRKSAHYKTIISMLMSARAASAYYGLMDSDSSLDPGVALLAELALRLSSSVAVKTEP